jgi:hypothetical protein
MGIAIDDLQVRHAPVAEQRRPRHVAVLAPHAEQRHAVVDLGGLPQPPTGLGAAALLQARRCVESGGRLWKTAEVDHRVPLFRVWSQHRETPWPALLDYWGLPNLRLINRDVHVVKNASEARDRRAARGRTALPIV